MPRRLLSTLSTLTLASTFASVANAQIVFHPAVNYAVGDQPEGGIVFDYDADGRLDIVVTSENPDKIQFLRNLGGGFFATPIALPTGNATSPEGLAVLDFDGDGDRDLVFAQFSANSVRLALNDGAGHFTLGASFPVGVEPSIVVAADFSGDGRPDAAVNDRVSGDVAVLINNGAGGFFPATFYPVGLETRCVATGDITGDGRPDLAVTARDDHRIRLFVNVGGGAFQVLRDLTMGSILEPQGVTLADFDSDGKLDVAMTCSGNSQQEHASVYLQDNFGNPWVGPINGQILPGLSPMGITTGDFDLDGHIDVATANADSGDVALLKNGGIGIFFLPVFYSVGENPEALVMASGDLDGNGTKDVVTFNRDDDNVSVLLNAIAPPRRHVPPRSPVLRP